MRQSKKKVNYTGFTKTGIDFFIPVDYNNFADEEEILNYGITAESQEVKFGDQTKYII